MNIRLLLLLCLGLWLLVGCSRDDDSLPLPESAPAPTIVPLSGRAAVVRHADLLNSPSQYSGMLVRISGQYRRLPQLICDGDIYRSPAGWKLVAGELLVQAAGFEAALRPLSGSAQEITVEGRWQRWSGLVGCGTEARQQEIWYLEVLRVVAPNPILFGTPAVGQPVAGLEPTPLPDTDGDLEEPELPAPPEDQNGREEEEPDDDERLVEPGQTATPTPTPTLTPTPGNGTPALGTATPTPTSTATPDPDDPDGLTPTPTSSATPEDVPPPPNVVVQGSITFEEIAGGRLAGDGAHAWEINVLTTGPITVTAIADLNTDVAIRVERPDGSAAVGRHNNAGMGQVETVVFNANQTGRYRLIIIPVSGSGDYALVALDEIAFLMIFPGNLRYGASLSASLPAESEHHWFFSAMAGDTVTIIASPATQSELIIAIFDPQGDLLSSYIESPAPGEPAELRTLLLPASGYYRLYVQEYGLDAAGYRLELIRN
jgi:hypothetical protein